MAENDGFKLKQVKELERYEGEEWVWTRKYDGTFCQVDVWGDGSVSLTGKGVRSGEYGEMFPEIVEMMEGWIPGKYLCEIIQVEKGAVKERFEWIQQRTSRKKGIEEMAAEKPCHLMVFDVLQWMNIDLKGYMYIDRLRRIADDIAYHSRLHVVKACVSLENKRKLQDTISEYDLEGIVIRPNNPVKCRDVGYKWKPEFTEDVWWEGAYVEGKGKFEGQIGSLITYQWVNGQKVEIKTGGMSDSVRKALSGLSSFPVCMEVACSAYLPSGKLRHPRFKRMRPDKRPEDCVRRWVDSQRIGPGSTNTE